MHIVQTGGCLEKYSVKIGRCTRVYRLVVIPRCCDRRFGRIAAADSRDIVMQFVAGRQLQGDVTRDLDLGAEGRSQTDDDALSVDVTSYN